MKNLLGLTLITFLLGACGQSSTGMTIIDADELVSLQGEGVQVIDVRTVAEVESGKIPGAMNVVFSDGFADKMKSFDKEEPVILYCQSGGRSTMASTQLVNAGFKNVYNYSGSYSDWLAQKRPIE